MRVGDFLYMWLTPNIITHKFLSAVPGNSAKGTRGGEAEATEKACALDHGALGLTSSSHMH